MVLQQIGQVFRTYTDSRKSEQKSKPKIKPRPGPSAAARTAATISSITSTMTRPSGALLPEPQTTRFGFLGVICTVAAGLYVGSWLSKIMANFLEEKELFIPSDDDDDDD